MHYQVLLCRFVCKKAVRSTASSSLSSSMSAAQAAHVLSPASASSHGIPPRPLVELDYGSPQARMFSLSFVPNTYKNTHTRTHIHIHATQPHFAQKHKIIFVYARAHHANRSLHSVTLKHIYCSTHHLQLNSQYSSCPMHLNVLLPFLFLKKPLVLRRHHHHHVEFSWHTLLVMFKLRILWHTLKGEFKPLHIQMFKI